jgi:hypothetical protein
MWWVTVACAAVAWEQVSSVARTCTLAGHIMLYTAAGHAVVMLAARGGSTVRSSLPCWVAAATILTLAAVCIDHRLSG